METTCEEQYSQDSPDVGSSDESDESARSFLDVNFDITFVWQKNVLEYHYSSLFEIAQ